jgi:hypothetical protein
MARPRDELCDRIESILRSRFPGDTIDASLSGIRNNVHVLVVSKSFDDLTESQKQERLWDILEDGGLSKDELGRISLILPLSVQELQR